MAGRSEPKDLTVVPKFSADHTPLLLPPMVVADSSPLKENISLRLSTSSNEACPVLTLFIIQLVLDDGFIRANRGSSHLIWVRFLARSRVKVACLAHAPVAELNTVWIVGTIPLALN